MPNLAIIFAGGTGSRMGNKSRPKQFLKVDGKPIIIHTLEHFQKHEKIDEIYIACKEEYIDYLSELLDVYRIDKVVAVVPGGNTGQDSIYNALKEARRYNDGDAVVLIHDGVRPVITSNLISDNIKSVLEYGTAITCTHCFETIIISVDGNGVTKVPFRKDTYAAQAPQSFYLKDILQSHEIEREKNPEYINIVDSCTMFKSQGRDVHLVPGNRGNIKITTPEDYFIFKALLQYQESQDVLGV